MYLSDVFNIGKSIIEELIGFPLINHSEGVSFIVELIIILSQTKYWNYQISNRVWCFVTQPEGDLLFVVIYTTCNIFKNFSHRLLMNDSMYT